MEFELLSADNIYNLSITLINVVGRCYREHGVIHAMPLLMAFLKSSNHYLTDTSALYSSVFEFAMKYYPDEINYENIEDYVEVALYFLESVNADLINEHASKLKYRRFWGSIIKLYMCVMTAHVKCEQCATARLQQQLKQVGTSNDGDFPENLLALGPDGVSSFLSPSGDLFSSLDEELIQLKRSFEKLTVDKMMNLLESNDCIGVIKPMKAHQVHQEEYAFFNSVWKTRFGKRICHYEKLNQVLLRFLHKHPLHVERMIFKALTNELNKNKSEHGEIQPQHLNNDLVKYFMSQTHQYSITPERTEK